MGSLTHDGASVAGEAASCCCVVLALTLVAPSVAVVVTCGGGALGASAHFLLGEGFISVCCFRALTMVVFHDNADSMHG